MTNKYKVLFLCRENSARSIMAEALLRELAGYRFDAFSAGPEPAARVHLLTVAQLRPGISDLGVLSPKSWLEFTGEWAPRMDLVITLDDSLRGDHAPVFPGEPECRHWSFADPLIENASDDERQRLFVKVFWQIVRQMSGFIELPQFARQKGNADATGNGNGNSNGNSSGSTMPPANRARCTAACGA